MRQYRPSIDELKKRYSMALARKRMTRLRHEKYPELAKRTPIPDNSVPWLPHPPRSVAECAWINQEVIKFAALWKAHYLKTPLSAS